LGHPVFGVARTSFSGTGEFGAFSSAAGGYFRSSIDPNYCSETLLETIRKSDFAFIKGVAGFETIQGLSVDTYYAFVVHSKDSQDITGYKKGSSVFVRIPPDKAGYHYQVRLLRNMYPMLNKSK